MNNLQTFILQEPTHIAATIVYIDEKDLANSQILPQSVCDKIDLLSRLTDVFFIFRNNIKKYVNPSKFSSLFNSVGYSLYKPSQVKDPEAVIDNIRYLSTVFDNKHLFIYYTELSNIDDIPLNRLTSESFIIKPSQVNKSIFSCGRIDCEWIAKLYTQPKFTLLDKIRGRDTEFELSDSFTTHKTDTTVIMLRMSDSFKKILNMPECYIKSFSEFRTLIPSAFNKLSGEEDYMDDSILDL